MQSMQINTNKQKYQSHQEKEQFDLQNIDSLITLRQKIFTFDVHGNASGGGPEKKDGNFDRSSKVRYKESFPASFGVLKQEVIWRPKIPCKRIFGQPKFLLSLQRKKVRVINGLRGSQLQLDSTKKNEFKSPKIKYKRQTTHRNQVISQPYRVTQNYTHTCLSMNLNQNHRVTKTPFLNFNLHHLIKQKKLCTKQSRKDQFPIKKGSNLPYYTSFSFNKPDKNNSNQQKNICNVEQQNTDNKLQIRTAKTRKHSRNRYNKSMNNQRRSQHQLYS